MRHHNTKNYYKAEQEEFEEKLWDKWVNMKCKVCSPSYCSCSNGDYYTHHEYSGGRGYTYFKPFECGAFSTCDFCYEYNTQQDRRNLIESYFTPQQILEALQKHLQDTNCWCYQRVKSHELQRRVDTLLRPRRSSSVVQIPKQYEEDVMTPCIVKLLDKQLGQEIRILHELKVRNEKIAVLAKYGLTLDEYHKIRIEKIDPQVSPIVLPQQKFIKVKESTLHEGSF